MPYDAIIIGGGPGGSTAASVLAQAGKKVLVLERERFPRFHVGESLIPYGNDVLREIGAWDKMVKQGFMEKLGAEFVLAVLGLFAYERPFDEALVLAAGIPNAWLDADEVGVDALPTWWGRLRYTLRRRGEGMIELDLAPGLRPPPGGIVIQPPLRRPLVAVEVDGRPIAQFDSHGVTLRQSPAHVVMRC